MAAEQGLLVLILDACDNFANSTGADEDSQRVYIQFETPSFLLMTHFQQLSFNQCLDHVITFLNAHLIEKATNSVAVVLCHQAGRL